MSTSVKLKDRILFTFGNAKLCFENCFCNVHRSSFCNSQFPFCKTGILCTVVITVICVVTYCNLQGNLKSASSFTFIVGYGISDHSIVDSQMTG